MLGTMKGRGGSARERPGNGFHDILLRIAKLNTLLHTLIGLHEPKLIEDLSEIFLDFLEDDLNVPRLILFDLKLLFELRFLMFLNIDLNFSRFQLVNINF